MNELPWEGRMEGFQLCGNTYFVGTRYASSHIIRSREGLILLDSGYQETLYQVIHSMHRCGLDPQDIKYIIHSHGHVDHIGATRTLVEMTGAETFIGAKDAPMVLESGHDLNWKKELSVAFYEFQADHLLYDGDRITLGDVVIDCVETPGHTSGVISFFWDIPFEGKVLRAGTLGGAGFNTLSSKYIHAHHLEEEDLRGAFRRSLERCRQEKVDVFIGNHAGQNNTPERYQRLAAGEKDAFVDPAAWGKFLDVMEQKLDLLEENDPL